jgi:hypothetical protein
MAETIRGVAVFWGIGSSFTASGTGIGASLRPQSVDFDVSAGVDVGIADYKGETIGRVMADLKETLKIEVIPTGATIAAAKAASILPNPGTVVTIVDTDDTEVAGVSTTAWLFIRGSKRRANNDVVKLTFELERMVANNITSTVS